MSLPYTFLLTEAAPPVQSIGTPNWKLCLFPPFRYYYKPHFTCHLIRQ